MREGAFRAADQLLCQKQVLAVPDYALQCPTMSTMPYYAPPRPAPLRPTLPCVSVVDLY